LRGYQPYVSLRAQQHLHFTHGHVAAANDKCTLVLEAQEDRQIVHIKSGLQNELGAIHVWL
jgi:hypothetical protein